MQCRLTLLLIVQSLVWLCVILMHSNRRGNCLYWEWVFHSEFVFAFKSLAGNTATVIIFSISINIILSRVGVRTVRFDKKFFIKRISQNFEKRLLASSCLSVRLTPRPSAWNNWAPHWTDFHEIWHLSIFRKSVQETQVSLKSDNQYTCVSCSVLLRMRKVSDKWCREWGG
jgi:hypothetical protein